MANYDVLIIGGGVIGLSIARELSELGMERISVVDRGRIGSGASWAAAGMLSPNAECEEIDDFYRFCDESRLVFPELASCLLAETGIDIELDQTGTIYAAFSDDDLKHLDKRFDRQKAGGIPVNRLSAAETLGLEPAIASNVRGSLLFPDDWQVENRKLVSALTKFVLDNGIDVMQNLGVESLIVEGKRVCGAVAHGRRLFADITVLATGAWASYIRILGEMLPFTVKPIRGQMISYKPVTRSVQHIIYTPRGYLVPRADGRILIGATVEDVGFDDWTTDEGGSCLSGVANEIAPFLANEPILEHWSGLRPFAPGGTPIIGPVPGFEGLLAATGHYRNGILLAPLTANLIAELIFNGTRSPYLDVFGPESWLDRGLNAIA